MSIVDRWTRISEGEGARRAALLALRVTTGFLMIWWGLAKALNFGVGKAVSDKFYGGAFSVDALLIGFGWFQALAGALIVLGLFRAALLPFQLVVNGFVAASVWWAIVDPWWLWLSFEKPFGFAHLFYPSAIVAAASFLLIAFRADDAWALDRALRPQVAVKPPSKASA